MTTGKDANLDSQTKKLTPKPPKPQPDFFYWCRVLATQWVYTWQTGVVSNYICKSKFDKETESTIRVQKYRILFDNLISDRVDPEEIQEFYPSKVDTNEHRKKTKNTARSKTKKESSSTEKESSEEKANSKAEKEG